MASSSVDILISSAEMEARWKNVLVYNDHGRRWYTFGSVGKCLCSYIVSVPDQKIGPQAGPL